MQTFPGRRRPRLVRLLTRNRHRFLKRWLILVALVLGFYWFIVKINRKPKFDPELMSYIFDNDLYTFEGNSFVVDTPTCRIPNFHPWSRPVELTKFKCRTHYDQNPPDCSRRYPRKWMYSGGMKLFLKRTVMQEAGFSLKSERCCYKVIERVEQSLEEFDIHADRRVRLSEQCHKINSLQTVIPFEFIQVFCVSKSRTVTNLSSTIADYRDFFAFPQLSDHARSKVRHWHMEKEEKKNMSLKIEFPPSVVIIMLDSVSRLNFRRRMPKTIKVLREAGAVELFGYTKVAKSTRSNTIAALTGLTKEEYDEICHHYSNYSHDGCYMVWKDFDNAGYLTVFTEDSGKVGVFNNFPDDIGFIKKPTDFYFRPMAIAWTEALRLAERVDFTKCVFQTQVDKFVLNYLMNIFDQTASTAPIFVHSLFAALSRDCIDELRYNDGPISEFIKVLIKNHPNTIFFLMGNHGDPYGPFRDTLMGWYEDQLPAMWVYLPSTVQQRFPRWKEALLKNSRRLTTHFDLYQTLVHILESYQNDMNQNSTPFQEGGGGGDQSLFLPVPENRTCSDARIPEEDCPCELSQQQFFSMNLDKRDRHTTKLLNWGTEYALAFLNDQLPNECARFQRYTHNSTKLRKVSDGIEYYLNFTTERGNFFLEAKVTLVDGWFGEPKFRIGGLQDIKRLNKEISKSETKCVDDPELQQYCYCS